MVSHPSHHRFRAIHRNAELALQEAAGELIQARSNVDWEIFNQLRFQSALYNYETSCDLTLLGSTPVGSISGKVLLKNLVHRAFEYNAVLSKSMFAKLADLARSRKLEKRRAEVFDLKQRWKSNMKSLEAYRTLRNKASGHYDQDSRHVVTLICQLDSETILGLIAGFLVLNIEYLALLSKIGRNFDA